jgi:phosphoribosylamine--glycine ligase
MNEIAPPKVKLHIRSKDGSGLCLGWKCLLEGAEVSASIIETKGNCQKQFSGILPIYNTNWKSHIDKDTVIVYDQVGSGSEADELKQEGYKVIGDSEFADKLELDRIWTMQLLESRGISTPPTHLFNSFDKAKQFIKDHKGSLVFKPCGELPPDTTYVSMSPDNEDMLYHLDKLEKLSKGSEFILQEKVSGIEVSTECWYYQGNPILPCNSTFEEKKMLNGDLGPSVGCAGSVVVIWEGDCFIYDRVFKSLEGMLRNNNYTGPLDWNCIFDPLSSKLYVLEATPRFGYDAIQNLCELMTLPMSQVLYSWGMGELETIPLNSNLLSLAVRVTIPFEVGAKDAPEGEYIGGYEGADGFWFSDVRMNSEGKLVTAGWDGNIVTVISIDANINIAKAKAYAKLDKLILGSKQYRTDIGDRFDKDWKVIKRANDLASSQASSITYTRPSLL